MQVNRDKKYDLKVLVVEDTIEIQFLIKTVLKFHFSDVITADNGLEGLKLYKEKKPDIIVTDVAMPEMDGIEMAKQIRKLNPDIPIILQTAFDDKRMLIDAIEIGIDYYLKKPLNNDKLIDTTLKVAELISLKKELEKQYDKNRLISLAVEQSPNRLILMNKDGIIEYCNPTFLESVGLTSSDFLGKTISQVSIDFVPNEILNEIFVNINNQSFSFGEFQLSDKNVWYSYTLNVIYDENRQISHFSILFVDITLRKLAEHALQKSNENLEQRVKERTQDLQKAKEAAEAADRAKSSFLAKVSHELRTPLNGILGLSSILIESEQNEKDRNFLDMIYSSGKNLLSIINDILDYSKLDAGKVTISEHKIILEVIVKNTIEMQLKDANDKGIIVNYIFDNKIPNELLGDSVRIQQVLTNLINNAIKFTDKGKVQVFVTLKELKEEYAEVQFDVRDTGIGIPGNKISELFQSFSQVENYMTRTRGGTGLGLAISKEIVELMGGNIWVESEENKGSSFKFTLKLKNPDDKSGMNEEQSKQHDDMLSEVVADYPDIKLNILIAEDSLINQEVLKQGLSFKNWNIVAVTNGADAIEVFQSMDIDLIFMDIQMPVMDGLTASEKINEIAEKENKQIIIIALTAHALDIHKSQCLQAGMNGFITKPFQWRQIYDMIYSFFGNGKQIDELKKIDLDNLLKSINYNKQVFKKIADYYQENYSITFNGIENSMKEGKNEDLKLKLHKLKSELGNFGAERAIAIIKNIEDSLTNDYSDNSEECLNNLRVELAYIDNEIKVLDFEKLDSK